MAEPFAINVASNLVSKLGEYLFAPIGNQFEYVLFYKSYIEDLEKGIEDLKSATERVQSSVDEAEYDGESILPDVTRWQESAKEEVGNAIKLSEEVGKAKNACFRGWVPNPIVRHPIGRKMKKMTQVIKRLIEESQNDKFQKVYYEITPIQVVNRTISTARYVNQKELVLESRGSIMKDVLKAISDDELCVIGVWGAGGVGKSRLLTDVKRRVMEENLFHVVMADVSPNQNLERIQEKIAGALGLRMKNDESTDKRANRLHKRLEKYFGKKILIILDNLYEKLELKNIGIPYKDNYKVRGYKLLLMSRYKWVLKDMDSEREFLLKKLEDEEARKLFEWTVGDQVNDPQFKCWVDGAVKCCGGLPLLIDSLAKNLKNQELAAWENPLINIKGSVVRPLVELNYRDLTEKRIKSLFLVCALTSERILMRNCLVYCMGLGLFNDLIRMHRVGTIEKARYWLITDLERLRDSSLLLDN